MSDFMSDAEFDELLRSGDPKKRIAANNEARRARDREAALEAKCDLLSASLRKADARADKAESERDALAVKLKASHKLREAARDERAVARWERDQANARAEDADRERDALRAEVERLRSAFETRERGVVEILNRVLALGLRSDTNSAREEAQALRSDIYDFVNAALARSEPKGERR